MKRCIIGLAQIPFTIDCVVDNNSGSIAASRDKNQVNVWPNFAGRFDAFRSRSNSYTSQRYRVILTTVLSEVLVSKFAMDFLFPLITDLLMRQRDVRFRFGPKVGQIGPKWVKSGTFSGQIQYILAHQSGSDWPQMGQNPLTFFRSDSVHFGAPFSFKLHSSKEVMVQKVTYV